MNEMLKNIVDSLEIFSVFLGMALVTIALCCVVFFAMYKYGKVSAPENKAKKMP